MVKFSARTIKDNVNVSNVSVKKEFLILTLGLLGICVSIYFILGVTLNILIDRIPTKIENVAGKIFSLKGFETPQKYSKAKEEIQILLDDLTLRSSESSKKYTFEIIENKDVNAFAIPGGRIVFFSGLLSEIESQNELAMILGHEIGHFHHRDHLRALSRGIVFVLIASVLFGTDSGVTNLVGGTLSAIDMKFSRTQESAADSFALDLINDKYGHVAGSTDFFQRIEKKRHLPEFLSFLLTHPLSSQRVDMINNSIISLDYSIEIKEPLSTTISELFEKKEEKM